MGKQLSNPNNIIGHSITIDSNQNVYTSAAWQGTASTFLDFDLGPNTFSVTTPNTTSSKLYVQKLIANGDFEWVNTFGVWSSTVNYIDPEQAVSVVVDSSDNLFFAGDLQAGGSSSTFNFGGETFTLNKQDIFYAKLNTITGQPEWSKIINNEGFSNVYSAVIDFKNNLIVSGIFTESIDLKGVSHGGSLLNSNGKNDAFIIKINLNNTLSINNSALKANYHQIYPNPFIDFIQIKSKKEILYIELYDLSGRRLFKQKNNLKGNLDKINLDSLSSGTYILNIIFKSCKSFKTKIIKV